MFLYKDKSYIKRVALKRRKSVQLQNMTYSCCNDGKHRPSKATLFLMKAFMQKISIQTAYAKEQTHKNKFPATGAEFILKK